MPEKKEELNILEQRKLERQRTVRKLRLLFAIGILSLILFTLVSFALTYKGDFSSITKGNGISNTVKNLGTTFTGGTNPTPTEIVDYSKPLVLPSPTSESKATVIPSDPYLRTYVSLVSGSNYYEATVRKGSELYFYNGTGSQVGLKFSNGKDLALRFQEQRAVIFNSKGDFSFEDIFDKTDYKITGVVRVVE